MVAAAEPQAVVALQQRPPLRELLSTLKDADPGLLAAFAKDIIERDVAVALFEQDSQLARVFALSGYFTEVNGSSPQESVAKAMAKVQLGRSWHMEPADAIQHIYIVGGRPAIQNEFLAARMRDAGLDWEIEWHREPNGECTGCTLWPSRLTTEGWKPIMERVNGESVPASVSFRKADAARVKVKEDGKWIPLSEKSTYAAWAEDMYFWRCIARLRRRYATNILSGVLTRAEAEDLPAAGERAPVPVREKLDVTADKFTSTRAARAMTRAEMPEIVQEAVPADPEPAEDMPQAAPEPQDAPLVYDTPETAVAAIRAIRQRRGPERFASQLKMIGIDRTKVEEMEFPQLRALVSRLLLLPDKQVF